MNILNYGYLDRELDLTHIGKVVMAHLVLTVNVLSGAVYSRRSRRTAL
jgi:hypothetical protein